MRLFVLVSALLLLGGCGASEPGVGGKVTGTVTIDGEKLGGGDVIFVSEDGKRTDTAKINAEGKYTLNNPPLGKCKVAVITSTLRGMKPPPKNAMGKLDMPGMVYPDSSEVGMTYTAIPERYEKAETSGLIVEVAKEPKTIDLPLTK